jgi:hypothetical protein
MKTLNTILASAALFATLGATSAFANDAKPAAPAAPAAATEKPAVHEELVKHKHNYKEAKESCIKDNPTLKEKGHKAELSKCIKEKHG